MFRLADCDHIDAITRLLETDAFPSDPIGMQGAGVFAIAANKLGAAPNSCSGSPLPPSRLRIRLSRRAPVVDSGAGDRRVSFDLSRNNSMTTCWLR